MLKPDELARYHRQLMLPEFGQRGQERLRDARVLIVGAGGLGSPAALYLGAAGVGTIGIIDDDVLDVGNLHRQVLHRTADIGRPKAESAADAIRALNPLVSVRIHRTRLEATGARRLFAEYDVIVDGSDNYPTRYVINDACAALGKTWVYGSVERFSGQVSVFGGDGPCYRCLFPEPPLPGASASCEEIGVLGAVPGVVGALQATETLKLLAGIAEPLNGKLLQLDLLRGETRTIEFERDPDCPSCGREDVRRSPHPPTDAPQIPFDIQPSELARRLIEDTAPALLDIREPWEWELATIRGARLLPMGDLQEKVNSLEPNRELVVYCHSGVRSRVATTWLRAQGFRARNLAGGIDRWSLEVDPAVPRY